MSFTLQRVDTGALTQGTGGADLLAMTTVTTPGGTLQSEDGDDLLLGHRGTADALHGGAGNDTMMGSHNLSLDLDTIATTGLFDLAWLFNDDGLQDDLLGGDGDDWLVMGALDSGDAGGGNDVVDWRFASGVSTSIYGDAGTDTVLARFAIGDSYVYDPAFAPGQSGMTQRFSLGSLGSDLFTDGFEVIRFANARGADGVSDLDHVLGSGDMIVGFDVIATAGQAVTLTPGVIDYLSDGTDPDEGFSLVGNSAFIEADPLGKYAFSVAVNGGAAQAFNGTAMVDSALGLPTGVLTINADHGVISLTYAAPVIDRASVLADLATGEAYFLGNLRLEGYVTITADYAAATATATSGVFTQTVHTWVDLVRATPESLNLRGAVLTTGVEIVGSDAANSVIATGFADTLRGSGGDDTLRGEDGNDMIFGGLGVDSLVGNNGDDTLVGNEGDDILLGQTGNDLLNGFTGNDLIYGASGTDTLNGGADHDTLFGGDGADRLSGSTGTDNLSGDNGDDSLYGGQGNDTLNGGGGKDQLFGDTEDDVLNGGSGNDTLTGGSGNDTIDGGDHSDRLFGGSGADQLSGGSGNDRLFGGADDDVLSGDDGSDMASGGDGNDVLYGGEGDDSLLGGYGADTLDGDAGNDTLEGDFGADLLIASAGSDLLIGGSDADTFSFRNMTATDTYLTTILDFTIDSDPAYSDVLDLAGSAYSGMTVQQLRTFMTDVTAVDGPEVHLALDGNLVVFQNSTTAWFNTFDHWLVA